MAHGHNPMIDPEVLAIFEDMRKAPRQKRSSSSQPKPRTRSAARGKKQRAMQMGPVVPAGSDKLSASAVREVLRLYYGEHHMPIASIAAHAIHAPEDLLAAVVQNASPDQVQAALMPSGSLLGGLLGMLSR